MEKINKTLKRLAGNSDFQKRFSMMKKEIMENKDVQAFFHQHSDVITREMMDRSLNKLYEFISQSKQCGDCPSLSQCQNMMQGYEPELVINGNSIDLQYHKCPQKIMHDERKSTEKLIQSIYVPKDILNANLAEFELDTDERMNAFVLAEKFVAEYERGKKMKGLFLSGSFGIGKSYLLGAIANQLAEKGVSTLIVYVPEFFREMKQSLGNQTVDQKLDAVKKAPVLMLDDIGAETMSSWTRDEVLGTILQFRMLENLPTFFSSNFDLKGLEYHLTYTQRGEEEKLKAARIIERIKYLAAPVIVNGPNRRN
ncbi:primosomal protein DnaI [Falsibacillus albus]|uniref:Primosomal protein DnaI n=1 Tax=Falsibacillus albus TaxID=2478915 RepID=A0A3L7K755_9BACI|nr:primosomal protein DnaI [Falsibacillus albus]RLQ97981.1 primosomal protein DnaI [Falsibacillus albus]